MCCHLTNVICVDAIALVDKEICVDMSFVPKCHDISTHIVVNKSTNIYIYMIKLFNIRHGISLLMGNIKVNITEFVGHSHSTIPIFRHVGNPTMPCFLSSQGLWQLTQKLAWLSITIFSILYLRDSPSYTEVGIKQTSTIRMPTFWEYPGSLPMNKFQTRSPINELGQDLDPRYVPTKFYHDRRRIALRRAVTGLAGQND